MYKDAAKVVIGVRDAVKLKELCFMQGACGDGREGGARRTAHHEGRRRRHGSGAWHTAVRTLHNILRRAAFRLWFDWMERRTVRRAMRLARNIAEAPCYFGRYATRPSPSNYYVPTLRLRRS